MISAVFDLLGKMPQILGRLEVRLAQDLLDQRVRVHRRRSFFTLRTSHAILPPRNAGI
jgi:hypothetical protein